ncbi:hypothetical protein ACFQL1_06910 [Halomicroarcula sp. GCM10025709]|uniref:hypothetical protein n=1 Tax=Halomicroarcula sp. GCM10025709 TaxID=3252669 RepID=UPI0036226EB0
MPPIIVVIGVAALMMVVLAHGYRTLTALSVLRSLPSAGTDTPPFIEDETVTVTGKLVVETPVRTAEAAVEGANRAVGAYLWRARFPDNTNSNLTIEDWGWEHQRWHTFASGIEWGRFSVAVDGQNIRIDPTWLREATETESLENLEIGGITKPDRFSVYLWDSWYTFLRDSTEHRSFKRFAGHVQRHNDGVDLDRYLPETRPLLEGTTVNVSGKVQFERGDPVLRGSNESPLLLSDGGFNGHRRWLRRRALRKGTLITGLLVVAVGLWFGWYLPLGGLIVGWIIYGAYRFTQDVDIFLKWIRR